MKPEEAFGKVMKHWRTEKGYSQEHLAHLCRLDRTFISLMERGQRQPSLTSILSISQALDVPADDMIKQVVESIG